MSVTDDGRMMAELAVALKAEKVRRDAEVAELAALRAENARLREALAKLVENHHARLSTLSAWNAARAALEPHHAD